MLLKCVTAFLKTDFEGERHIKRVEKLDNKFLGDKKLLIQKIKSYQKL